MPMIFMKDSADGERRESHPGRPLVLPGSPSAGSGARMGDMVRVSPLEGANFDGIIDVLGGRSLGRFKRKVLQEKKIEQ